MYDYSWKEMELMKKSKNISEIIIIVATIVTALVGSYMAYEIPITYLQKTLSDLSQLNVSIAVGICALSIGYVKNNNLKRKFTEYAIAFSMLSILSFSVAQIEIFPFVKRIYLNLNIISICIILFSILKSIKNK